jgi:hypothetical protein
VNVDAAETVPPAILSLFGDNVAELVIDARAGLILRLTAETDAVEVAVARAPRVLLRLVEMAKAAETAASPDCVVPCIT